jgi:cephalosporin hydroxylase
MRLSDLHATNPYKDFPFTDYPNDVYTQWGSEDPGFRVVFDRIKPKLVIEVGSWKGGSVLHMADLADELGLETQFVCVDTWQGSLEFWLDQKDPTRYGALDLMYGYPMVYFQFLANVCHANQQDRIIPFPQASQTAAKWFATRKILADAIYIDGSHEYDDVLSDIGAYWSLVRSGGILFGDDYGVWGGVSEAVQWFRMNKSVKVEIDGRHWRMVKR